MVQNGCSVLQTWHELLVFLVRTCSSGASLPHLLSFPVKSLVLHCPLLLLLFVRLRLHRSRDLSVGVISKCLTFHAKRDFPCPFACSSTSTLLHFTSFPFFVFVLLICSSGGTTGLGRWRSNNDECFQDLDKQSERECM